MARKDDESASAGGDTGGPFGGEPLSLDGLRIPDDARELDGELRALRRERRAAARRAWLRRVLAPVLPRALPHAMPRTRRRRHVLTGPFVLVSLAVVAGLASLMVLFQPRQQVSRQVPLATTGVRRVGLEGGLIPDLTVHHLDGTSLRLRSLRPAVIAVLPAVCGCDNRLREVGLTAARHRLPYLLVGRMTPKPPADLDPRLAVRATETAGELARTYHVPDGMDEHPPVLLLVRADGVVNRIVTDLPSTIALDGELAVLAAGLDAPAHS